MHLVNPLKLAKLMLFLMLSFALHQAWADRPLDADGKPLPPNMAALIGKKFKALPVDPKLGDKSPVLPEIDGWRFVIWDESEGKVILQNRSKSSWLRKYYQPQLRNLSERQSSNIFEKASVCEISRAFALTSNTKIAIAALKYCADETFEIMDLLFLPYNFGIVTTRKIPSKTDVSTEYKTQKNTGFAFLPSKYFQNNSCNFYLIFDIEIESIQGKSYILNDSLSKFQRNLDTSFKAANPNIFCGGFP